jgi:hypothetical protein
MMENNGFISVDESEEYTEGTQAEIRNLKKAITDNLILTGFTLGRNGELIVPNDKEYYRKVNAVAVEFLKHKKSNLIARRDQYFLDKYIINGRDLDVRKIDPVLVEVVDNEKADLFNWIKLHWSVPISSGYGRRLRYIVMDRSNDAVMGIIGLGDPVYAMHDRDSYIGWSNGVKKERLRHLMDAFVLGSVPPYSAVLGGKLVASLISSVDIRKRFYQKYKGSVSRISGMVFDGRLAGITTSSALGKSSLYDRIRIPNGPEFVHVGWTKGSGEFQFLNGLYDKIYEFAKADISWKKNPLWGSGIRNRRTLIQATLKKLGMPLNLGYHNIRREVFFVSLGFNSKEFLCGQSDRIKYYELSIHDISTFMLKRWVIPRSERDKIYKEFNRYDYSIDSTKK